MQDKYAELHDLVARARAQRSLYLAQLIADGIFAVHQFALRLVRRVRAAPSLKPASQPATQR